MEALAVVLACERLNNRAVPFTVVPEHRLLFTIVPAGSHSRGGDVRVYVLDMRPVGANTSLWPGLLLDGWLGWPDQINRLVVLGNLRIRRQRLGSIRG